MAFSFPALLTHQPSFCGQQSQDSVDRLLQFPAVNPAGEMDRTFAVHRIPSARVGGTEKLGLQAYFPHRILDGMTDQPLGRLPGRPAGGATDHLHLGNLSVGDFHCKFRGSEILAIITKTNLSWKTTSGRRSRYPFAG